MHRVVKAFDHMNRVLLGLILWDAAEKQYDKPLPPGAEDYFRKVGAQK